jgi:hypothetical protein
VFWSPDSDEEDDQQQQQQQQPGGIPAKVAALKAKEAAEAAAKALESSDDDVDPLDAFMAGEVLPEVAAREAEEKAARDAARVAAAAALAAGKKLPSQKVLEDSDSEEEPDLEIQVGVCWREQGMGWLGCTAVCQRGGWDRVRKEGWEGRGLDSWVEGSNSEESQL